MIIKLKEQIPELSVLEGERIDRISYYKDRVIFHIDHLTDMFPNHSKGNLIFYVMDDTEYDVQYRFIEYESHGKLKGTEMYKEEHVQDPVFNSHILIRNILCEQLSSGLEIIIIGKVSGAENYQNYEVEIDISCKKADCQLE